MDLTIEQKEETLRKVCGPNAARYFANAVKTAKEGGKRKVYKVDIGDGHKWTHRKPEGIDELYCSDAFGW